MGSNQEPHHSQEVIKHESLPAHRFLSLQEEDDDGPPPGFDSIPFNLSTNLKEYKSEIQEEGDDDDGPPPGFHSIPLKNEKSKEKIIQEDEEDDDGPPPGFGDDVVAIPISHPLSVIEVEKDNGLKPNSQSVDGSKKLGFQHIPERGGDDVAIPNPHSIPVVEGKTENGLKSDFDSQAVGDGSDENVGFQTIPREGEREGDGVELGLQSIVENEEEKSHGSELGFQSVVIEKNREREKFELGSKSVPVKEDEKEQSISDCDDDDDEGPPPGWDLFPQASQPINSLAPPHCPPSSLSCGIGSQSAHIKEEEKLQDECEFGSQSVAMKEDGKGGVGFELKSQSISAKEQERASDGEGPSFPSSHIEKEDDDEGPPPGWDSSAPTWPTSKAPEPSQLSPFTSAPPHPPPSVASSGKAQMVCGSCQKLLSYSRGARFVKCSCCQTVNLVLEEHQVGQVKCRGCAVLLMYPFGAPSVQCSSCLFVTKVGVQNKRPPLSVQQGRQQLPANPVH